MKNTSLAKGLVFAFLCFGIWGILPLYWRLLARVDPLHILAFRILFSLLVVGAILLLRKNTKWLAVFKDRKKAGISVLAGIVLCANWGLYVWAVNSGHTIEASLGYYINPLVSVGLGLLFYREKMRPLQWAAFGSAGLGVLILTLLSGVVPWISLTLAVSFALYGLLKKKVNLSALESLGAETLASVPIGLCLIFGWQNISYLTELPWFTWIPLLLIGAVSAAPLYFFAHAAKLLPLSTLGFAQLLSPTLQFFVGLFIFGEYFPGRNFIAYGFIWLAMILYVISLKNPGKNK
jgi:chloramphenicol-sensitive protein RarD